MFFRGYVKTFQSTPSAWRETQSFQTLFLWCIDISIHSLRMEGDYCAVYQVAAGNHFNPLPPHGGRRLQGELTVNTTMISIHSLRMEGDLPQIIDAAVTMLFQSTPSAWRETVVKSSWLSRISYFNPLPPHGGRQCTFSSMPSSSAFQSTPSAWRETAKLHRKAFFISPILVQSCKKGCKRLHSAPEKMVFFEKREKNLVRNLQHLSVRL